MPKKKKVLKKLSKKPKPNPNINEYIGYEVFEVNSMGAIGLPSRFSIGDKVSFPSASGSKPSISKIKGIYTDGKEIRYQLTNCLYLKEKDLTHAEEVISPKGRIKRKGAVKKKVSKKAVKKPSKQSKKQSKKKT